MATAKNFLAGASLKRTIWPLRPYFRYLALLRLKGREESVQRIDYGMREFIILKEEASVAEDAANTGSCAHFLSNYSYGWGPRRSPGNFLSCLSTLELKLLHHDTSDLSHALRKTHGASRGCGDPYCSLGRPGASHGHDDTSSASCALRIMLRI